MNSIIISGNLGADPELRKAKSGVAVCNLSVATNERDKVNGQWTDHTEWHRVVVFNAPAENCARNLSKGSKVIIQGKLRSREYTDKTGAQRKSWEIIADRVEFAGRPPARQSTPTDSAYAPAPATPFPQDDIPF
jgi:single-strand DNA-binding protein